MKCIKLAGIYVFCLASSLSFAQNTSDIGRVSLAVSMPMAIEGLDASQLAKLSTKITQIATANGVVASLGKNVFTLYPTFTVIESSVVEGGLSKLTVTKTELGLAIKQSETNTLFSTTTKAISGSGNTIASSIANAISKITPTDPQFKQFIEAAKVKIVNYYDQQCDQILSKSENLMLLQNYEQSLALLMSVPQEVSCFSKIQERSMVVYQALQNQKCAKQLQSARAMLTANKFSEVLDLLSEIDPAASCFAEAQTMLKSIENKISEEEKKEWEFLMMRYKDTQELEKARINAIKEIAVSYANPQPKQTIQSPPASQTKAIEPDRNVVELKPLRAVDSSVVKRKHRFYALLMGVETYTDPEIVSLNEPIKDAGLLKNALIEKYTFEESDVTFLKNPTFEDINVAFEDLSKKIEPSDYLLIFYAGHGYFDEKTNIGYWLPADAQKKTRTKWFRNSALVENIRAINSKHTMLIADACFSGGIFKTRAPFDNASVDIADMMKHASRKAMTSGSLTTVPDKSVFMKYFLKILLENQNKYLPTEDLFDEVKRAMKSNSDTKPLYGEIQNSGDEGGNFVLIKRE